MELNDIKIFIELYNNRSISKTAEKLNYTQSNISTRLMKIEKELNSVFFTRTKSGLEILPAAEHLMNYAIQIDQIMNRLLDQFNAENKELHIGSTQLLSHLYFPILYKHNSNLHLHTTSLNKLVRNFDSKVYDIIITHTKMDTENNLAYYHKSEQLCWTQSKNFLNSKDKNTSIIVSRDKSCPLRNTTFHTLTQNKVNMPIIEVDTLDLVFSLLLSVNSIALLPKKLIDSEHNLGVYTNLDQALLHVYFYYNTPEQGTLLENLFY